MLAYLNGQFLPRSAATVSVDDRGFVFGDGVYEVWRVIDGQLFEFERHRQRLLSGLRELHITPPAIVGAEALPEMAERLLGESSLATGEATLYLEITRGASPRAHQFPPPTVVPTVYATVKGLVPPDEARRRGVRAITLPDIRWARCDIKTLQLLPNVMAQQSAVDAGAADALLVRDGVITEGSHTNVIGVIDGVLRTHPTTNHILPGITRGVVLELAAELGIPVVQRPMVMQELSGLDELFLVGTTTDVMPVVEVDEIVIGSGVPGEVTLRLQAALRSRLDALRSAHEPAAARAAQR